jgi:hypothetical protein
MLKDMFSYFHRIRRPDASSISDERINSDSDREETNDCHQNKHNQDPTMHEMVVPFGLAVLQLIPWFFAIFHR